MVSVINFQYFIRCKFFFEEFLSILLLEHSDLNYLEEEIVQSLNIDWFSQETSPLDNSSGHTQQELFHFPSVFVGDVCDKTRTSKKNTASSFISSLLFAIMPVCSCHMQFLLYFQFPRLQYVFSLTLRLFLTSHSTQVNLFRYHESVAAFPVSEDSTWFKMLVNSSDVSSTRNYAFLEVHKQTDYTLDEHNGSD